MGKRRGSLTEEKERIEIQDVVSQAIKLGMSQKSACAVLGISPRTLQRWKKKKAGDGRTLNKREPHNKLSFLERQKILRTIHSRRYSQLPPSKIVPLLASSGEYLASEATLYRILKEEKLLKHRLPSQPRRFSRPKALVARAPNQIYSWDITYLRSNIRGCFFYLYLILDLYSRKIVGWQVYEKESNEHASEVIKDACYKEGVKRGSLVLHSDNGGPMKGATMLSTLQKLGVLPSFSRPSVSNDNPYSEALFRTLKYTSQIPLKPFQGLLEAREKVLEFVNWYNNEHLHSGIKFVTPALRHALKDQAELKKRHEIYLAARAKNPGRWTKNTRNWDHIKEVYLNPEKGKIPSSKSQGVV